MTGDEDITAPLTVPFSRAITQGLAGLWSRPSEDTASRGFATEPGFGADATLAPDLPVDPDETSTLDDDGFSACALPSRDLPVRPPDEVEDVSPLSPLLGAIAAELVAAGLLKERRAVSNALKARDAGETFVRMLAQDAQDADLEPIYEFLAGKTGTELIRRKGDLLDRVIDADWLPMSVAEQRGVLLLKPEKPGEAPFATTDPFDLLNRDWIGRCTGKRAIPVPVMPGVFLDAVSRLRVRASAEDDGKMLIPIDISWQQGRGDPQPPRHLRRAAHRRLHPASVLRAGSIRHPYRAGGRRHRRAQPHRWHPP